MIRSSSSILSQVVPVTLVSIRGRLAKAGVTRQNLNLSFGVSLAHHLQSYHHGSTADTAQR